MIKGVNLGLTTSLRGAIVATQFIRGTNGTKRDRVVRNLFATFLVLLATAQPAICCCPEPETPHCGSCFGGEHASRGATVHRMCNCHGQAGGCGCEGHPCASTQRTSAAREKSSYPSKETVTDAFQPAGNALLQAVARQSVGECTPSTLLSKCRPHLLLGHLVI